MANSNRQLQPRCALKETRSDKFGMFELEYKRIGRLVDETVNKLTFAMTIPKLLDNDFELIKEHLTEEQLDMLKQVFSKYFPSESLWMNKKTTHYSKLSGLQTVEMIEEYFNSYCINTENVPQRDEYHFSNALQFLCSNENIKALAISNKFSISEAGFNFIQDMKLFFYSLLNKMKLSPTESQTKEAYLRKLCHHHKELTDEAHILEEEAMLQAKNTQELLKSKLADVLEIKQRSDSLMEDCRTFVQRSGAEANKQMIFNWKSSEHQQELLDEKVSKQIVDLETLRKKYVEEEKELRTKRYKTEQNLISFLEQYDKDMQNKQNELDSQNEVVAMEKEQYDELNENYQEQEKIYDLLMKEKAEYEKRLFEAKLYELKCAVSARKIQRYYKNFRKLLRIAGKKDLLRKKTKRKK